MEQTKESKAMTCSKLTKLLLGSQKSHTLVILESPIACAVGLQGLPLVAIACEEQVLFSPIASQTIIFGKNVDLVDGRSRRLLLGGEPKLGFNCRGNLCKRNTNIDKSPGSRSRIRKKKSPGWFGTTFFGRKGAEG